MGERIKDVDFWRGAAQIAIVVDHIPGCILDNLTPTNFGFSDAAEGFVFLSGVSAGLAYLPKARRSGTVSVASICVNRAIKLYCTNIGVTLAALAVFAAVYAATGAHALVTLPFTLDLGSVRSWAAFLTLQRQLSYFSVLALYVVLSLWTPVAVAMTTRNQPMAIAVSAAIYLSARLAAHIWMNGPAPPNSPVFNPLDWQLLFTIGIVCAAMPRQSGRRRSLVIVLLCVAMLIVSAIFKTSGLSNADWIPARIHGEMGKGHFGLVRMVHFLALAYCVRAASMSFKWVPRLVDGKIGRILQALGRNSLAVFVVGSMLSALARLAIAVGAEDLSGVSPLAFGAACGLASAALLIVVGLRIDRSFRLRLSPASLATGD